MGMRWVLRLCWCRRCGACDRIGFGEDMQQVVPRLRPKWLSMPLIQETQASVEIAISCEY